MNSRLWFAWSYCCSRGILCKQLKYSISMMLKAISTDSLIFLWLTALSWCLHLTGKASSRSIYRKTGNGHHGFDERQLRWQGPPFYCINLQSSRWCDRQRRHVGVVAHGVVLIGKYRLNDWNILEIEVYTIQIYRVLISNVRYCL